jgi:hypothetical protein
MTDKTYNGWTNYETWRVNLEIFDGFDYTDHGYDGLNRDDAYDLGEYLKEYAEEVIFAGHRYDERGQTNLMEDYARAFLQDVNWREIAKHMIADHEETTE